MGSLYDAQLSPISIRRKLAAVRSFFKHLQRAGVVTTNVARLVRTPKAPKTLPAILSAEQMSTLLNDVPKKARIEERPYPERDIAILEMSVRVRIRVSEWSG